MGKSLSPLLSRELANLDKDVGSRKSAMKALKSYVKDLDSKSIPQFLAQVFSKKSTSSPSGEYTISLYEVLARVHGRNIVPQIDNIMSTIVKTLLTSAGSFPLHQACSKVVPAIARYGIDTSTPDEEKTKIIYSLCKPLSDLLMGSPESASGGAALCMKALVETDNWGYASNVMVNEVFQRVAGALEETISQTNFHIGLAIALAKCNSLILETYVHSLVLSGLQILVADVAVGNSHKRFLVIQMIDVLMKSVDSRCISSEILSIIDMMEKCYSGDQMPFVRAAAFEALQTAKMVEKGSRFDKSPISTPTSRFVTRDCSKWNFESAIDMNQSPRLGSPESLILQSFNECDSSSESSMSIGQASHVPRNSKTTNRRLWNDDIGGIDVSLKGGLCSAVKQSASSSEICSKQRGDGETSDKKGDCSEEFCEYRHETPKSVSRCTTPSPQKAISPIGIEEITIFKSPRKLIQSLQSWDDEVDTELPRQQIEEDGHPICESEFSPRKKNGESLAINPNLKTECEANPQPGNKGEHGNAAADAALETEGYRAVPSTEDGCAVASQEPSSEEDIIADNATDKAGAGRQNVKKGAVGLVFAVLLLLPVLIFSALLIDHPEDCINLVPT